MCDFENLPCAQWKDSGKNTVLFDEPMKDELNWTVKRGTGTDNTGPQGDHTTGEGKARSSEGKEGSKYLGRLF